MKKQQVDNFCWCLIFVYLPYSIVVITFCYYLLVILDYRIIYMIVSKLYESVFLIKKMKLCGIIL